MDLANPYDSDQAATHRSVLEETAAMERLVDDLLYLARSDAGRQPRRSEAVDLDDLVMSEAIRLRADSGLEIDASKVSAGQVRGDRNQLGRALRNLVDNAVRHAAGRVILELSEHDDGVVLAVADDGPGVPADQRERVFERFARTDEGRSADDGGSGLGLSIVRDVVMRHGGNVVLDTGYVSGARFVVTLPRATRD